MMPFVCFARAWLAYIFEEADEDLEAPSLPTKSSGAISLVPQHVGFVKKK